jgi:pimeloyl-ACP methyl ester carboxylesterase
MKNIKFLILLFTFVVQVSHLNGQPDRDFVLMHGLGDGNNAWRIYTPFLQSLPSGRVRRVYPTGYDVTQGVQVGVNWVNAQFSRNSNSQGIAIGQSMGGIVARESDRQHPNVNYGGIITLGSPNRGGAILNGLQTGTVQAELYSGCKEMADAAGASTIAVGLNIPSSSNLVVGIILGLFQQAFISTGASVVAFQNLLCTELIDNINLNIPTRTVPRTATDLSEGSGILATLNSTNTPSFKIGVFGVENSPVHMRVLSSLRNPSFLMQPDVTNDEELVQTFHKVRDILNSLGSGFATIAVVQAINAIWNWPLLISAAVNAWASYECFDAVFWLNRSESKWHQLIGAGGFYTEQRGFRWLTSTCQQQINDAFDLYEQRQMSQQQWSLIHQMIYSDPTCFETVVSTVSFPINNESDGLFNAGTQRIPTDPFDPSHVINLQVDGVNHREFYNHSSMTQRFQQIFRGETEANRFFRLL